jgi:hypothetical protein
MPIPGGPNDSSPPPGTGASDLSGDAYLSTLDKPTASMVKALAEGRKSFPSGAALKAPYWQNMLAHVGNYDPGFDETTYTTRSATRKDFSIGAAGKNIRALNTAIAHLGQLYGQIPNTASHSFSVAGIPLPGATAANALENAYMTSSGDQGPGTYRSTTSALAGELTAVYRGAGGAEADIQRYINELSPNQSLEQKQATIRNISSLLNGRLQALQDQYQKGMGVGAQGYQFLDPHAQQVLSTINGGPPPSGPSGFGGGGGGNTPPGIKELSPDQQSQEKAFLATKPTAEAYAAFLGKLQRPDGPPVDLDKAKARLDALNKGANYNPNIDETAMLRERIANENKLGVGENPAETLIKQGATLNLSDEAAGVGNALAHPLHPIEGYTLGRDTERERIADARQSLGYASAPIEFVGGMAAAAPTSALAALTSVPAMMRQGATGGAVGGALAGFGAGQGASQSVTGAGVGAAGGAAVGALAPYAANKVAAMRAPQGMAPELAQAAKAEGVDLIRPMVDPASRGKFGELESNPVSQNTIRRAVDRVKSQIADRVAALGQGGNALETDAAGEVVQNGARRFIQRTKGVADKLYNIARTRAGDTRFVPKNAIDAVDQSISQLSANKSTNAGEISFLNGIKDDLSTPGGKTVEELRQLRQSLRGRVNEQNLTATQAEGRAIAAMDATHLDAAANLPKGASDAYRRADAFYRERMVHIDDVLERFLGGNVEKGQARLSGEQAFQKLKNMMSPGGDSRRLAGLMRDMEPNERQDIAATIASSLGRRSADEPFSANLLISQTNKLSPQAQRTAFGPDGAESIKNLRTVAQALKDAGGDVNYTRSGSNVIRYMAKNFVSRITGLGSAAGAGFLAGGGSGAAAGAMGAAGVASVGAGAKLLSARAMVNPRVSMWLADAAKVSTPSQAKQAVKGLSLVISREPALANELAPIRDFLDQRVTQLLAAQPDGQGGQPQAPRPLARGQYNEADFGKRPDGTAKGTGFLGVLHRPDGNVSTEISVGVPVNGKEMDIPTMVPGLSQQEVNWLLTTPVDRVAKELPDSIRQKAIAHARQRIARGLSPFKQDNEP